VVIPGALAPGQEAPDPMILVSVMGTVQYGLLEAKPPPEARPFTQSFVRPPPETLPSHQALLWTGCDAKATGVMPNLPFPLPLLSLSLSLSVTKCANVCARERERARETGVASCVLLAATDSGAACESRCWAKTQQRARTTLSQITTACFSTADVCFSPVLHAPPLPSPASKKL
jgi:hypothetical protein